MYAVIRHTYKLDIPEPSNAYSTKSSAKWIHLVWMFDTELEALTFAISLLDDPLIMSNKWLVESAIKQLEEDRYYQIGRESVAIAEVLDSPQIVYGEIKDEKSIH